MGHVSMWDPHRRSLAPAAPIPAYRHVLLSQPVLCRLLQYYELNQIFFLHKGLI